MSIAQDLVAARLYENEDAVVSDALRHLLRARPDLRISLAVYRYQRQEISLAKAAALAGVSWPQMREILIERGVTLALGPETIEEAAEDVAALRKHLGLLP